MRDYGTPMEENLTAQIAIQADLLTSEIACQKDLLSSSRNIKIFINTVFIKSLLFLRFKILEIKFFCILFHQNT
jgi:hypothetical protein